jgi:hypothetical protein
VETLSGHLVHGWIKVFASSKQMQYFCTCLVKTLVWITHRVNVLCNPRFASCPNHAWWDNWHSLRRYPTLCDGIIWNLVEWSTLETSLCKKVPDFLSKHSYHCLDQRNLSMPGNITFKCIHKTFTWLFKHGLDKHNWESLDSSISRYGKISLVNI